MPQFQSAPKSFMGILRQLGPGLIVTAAIVGSGELILTPKLGADVGFVLLWFIILGCTIKVFVQVELGRFAIARGMTTLEAMNSIPGPRLIVSWLVWLWLLMYLALVFQIAGILGGVANVFSLGGTAASDRVWAILVAASCAILLGLGRYQLVESLSTLMVALFTLCTLVAVGALQWTDYALRSHQILEGFTFQLPSSFTTAFAAFGIIGVGASELVYYPYWCLEKGYARHVGPHDNSPEWSERARGWVRIMTIDAWVSMVVYTGATIAFYLLGAAVLHGKKLVVTNDGMIATLSHMYKESFGAWGLWVFLFGAFMVLYSTVFVATASNARLFADAASLFKIVRYRDGNHREKWIRMASVALPTISLLMYLAWGAPITLVLIGAVAQALMLPFLGIAAVYFHFQQRKVQLGVGPVWRVLLCISALSMVAVGVYQLVDQIQKLRP
jgi:manganese transport protein